MILVCQIQHSLDNCYLIFHPEWNAQSGPAKRKIDWAIVFLFSVNLSFLQISADTCHTPRSEVLILD